MHFGDFSVHSTGHIPVVTIPNEAGTPDDAHLRASTQTELHRKQSSTGQRIVHVTSVHVWSDTRIYHRMCLGLANRGWDVHLVAPGKSSGHEGPVQVHQIHSSRYRLVRVLVCGYNAIAKAKSLQGDVYHLHDPELLLWAWLLRGPRRAVIYDMHEFVPGAITTRPWIPRVLRRPLAFVWERIERWLLHDVPVVFAETAYSKHYHWVNDSAIVLNLPELKSLIEIVPSEVASKRVVYVGSISEARGSVVMLKAIRLLQQRGINIEFDCVGHASPEHMAQLEQLVSDWSLKSTRFHGYKRPVDAWRIASGAVVGLAILQPEPNYVESYPTKMFEYMALKLPVVASDFPLYREVITAADCGSCVSPGDPSAVAQAIEDILMNPERATQLGENGRQAVLDKYHWEPQLDRLETLYLAVFARFGRPI